MVSLQEYTNRYRQLFEGKGSFETVMVEVRRRQVLASIARYPHGTILEVGCGMEPLFPHVNSFERFTVVEPSSVFAERARSLAVGRDRVEVIEGYIEIAAEQLAERSFDFIVASSLLHEVADPRRLLAALRSLAGDRTVVHVNVPNVRSFHRLLALEMGLISDLFEPSELEQRFGRTTRFDKERLFAMVSEAGFRPISFATYFLKPFSNAQMEALFEHGILPREAIPALDAMTKFLPEMGAEMYVELVRDDAAGAARP